MKTLKGPSLFLSQFIGDAPPFNRLETLAAWASGLGYKAVQLPTHLPHIFDLDQAAASQIYCDEVRGKLADVGLVISELSTHLQGQLVAVHPAYELAFAGFAPDALRHDRAGRQQWAVQQLMNAATASQRLGLKAHATFSGALAWPYFYPWPPRNVALIDEAFTELARRWTPILNRFDEEGVDLCYELHPGEDLHDGATFGRFLELTGNHPRCNILFDPSHMVLQQMDYLGFIDYWHERIRAFHVKDAEFTPSAQSGVYGGYQAWIDRPGRFRSLGDGQVNFKGIFSKLAQYDYDGWATLEWECCLKNGETGAREGAKFITDHIIHVADHAFDDFALRSSERSAIRQMLGLSEGS
ncbi:sugar phosphate isomerase/epimerase family protein [Atlantibacter hermannii]|uniref:sugar phosphate isomerase/epimerase family protein n=1 Tax=Atlantibacter hermannii TaxID=565 RepID=UPI001C7020C8|nr:sugar phosphate isomerase/epimerase [Atlantibacter hermannii]MBW9431803.1 sugar phosphate isomerase/epimerase [Atlantibacter hermannii]WIF56465.1 sugar phosphate isomerase/epimerase [Atlantibacter hermannii]